MVGRVRGADVLGEIAARQVARNGPAGVEDFRVAEAIDATEQRGKQLAQLAAQEARGAEAVRLEHGYDARRGRLRGGERRADLFGVVREVVDHPDARGGDADGLEAARDARKA